MSDRILIIRNGGTIDAESYDDSRNPPKNVKPLPADKSLIAVAVAQLPNHGKVDYHHWDDSEEIQFVKDSEFYTEKDIAALATLIRNHSHRFFIMPHGTDYMTKNALALQALLQGSDKVVGFIGSIVPLSMDISPSSDGVGALEYVLKNIYEQPPGVWISGWDAKTRERAFFDPAVVRKDRELSLASKRFTLVTAGVEM